MKLILKMYFSLLNVSTIPFQHIINIKIFNEIFYNPFDLLRLQNAMCVLHSETAHLNFAIAILVIYIYIY